MATVTQTDTDSTTTGGSSFTFTCTVNAGGSGRTFFFVFAARKFTGTNGSTLSSVTVDGVAATVDLFATSASSGTSGLADSGGIARIAASSLGNPSASSVSVVITFTESHLRCGVATYVTADTINSIPADTASFTSTGNQSSPFAVPLTIDKTNGGFTIAGAFLSNDTAPNNTGVWANLTADTAVSINSTNILSVAHESAETAAANIAVTCTFTDTVDTFIGLPVGFAVTYAAGGPTDNTLNLNQGSYTLTGKTLNQSENRNLNNGTYSLTGQSVSLDLHISASTLSLSTGNYTLTGTNINILYTPSQAALGGYSRRRIEPIKPDLSASARHLGSLGGHARAANLSAKQRSSIASKAASIRWNTH